MRRSLLTALALVLAACSDGGTSLENVASVRVTPSQPLTEVGLAVQFTAEALDAGGNPVPGITFEWTSSNTSVATISSTGLAQALATGSTTIEARAGAGTPGQQVLVVEASTCTDRVDVLLSVGQHQSYDGDQCLLLPAGASGDRYRVAVVRPTLIEDPADTPEVWMVLFRVAVAQRSDGLVPSAAVAGGAPPAPATYSTRPVRFEPQDRIDGAPFVRDREIMARTRRAHLDLRQREREVGLRSRPVLPSLRAVEGPARSSGPALADPPATDRLFLGLECSPTAIARPVRLMAFNDDLAIYQDSVSNASDPLSAGATTMMLDYYSAYVRDFADQYWGATPDIDGNGRVLITTSPGIPDSAAAAVFSGDFKSTIDCPGSNEAEIMYFDRDVLQNLDPVDPADESFLGLSVMAHEVKHVTSLYNSIARGSFHSIWIEEGTAEISQTMSSRIAWEAVGGPAVGSVLDGNDIIAWNNTNGEIGPEAWGVVTQIADLVVNLSTQPNSLITNPQGAAEFHTFYAGGWHWHRFIGDAFGDAATPYGDGPLFVEMTDSLTPSGTGALLAVTGRTFEQLFEDLIVAASFHDAGPTPARAFTTWDLHTAGAIFAGPPSLAPPHRYPWPVTTDVPADPNTPADPSRGFDSAIYSCPPLLVGDEYVEATASDRCPMGPSGIRLHDFVSDGQGLGAQIRVFGAPNGKLIVTRIN